MDYLGCRAEVLTVDPYDLDEVLQSIRRLGKATGTVDRAEELLAGLTARLDAVADRVAGRAAAARDKAVAEVRTAVELDQPTLDRLTAALSKATGKDVEVKVVVDPTVIGGVVARVGDVVIDGTVSHRLQQLRETLNKR